MKSITRNPEIVAISGNGASGKDTIARVFVERGFAHVSTSDIVREIIVNCGSVPCRELQNKVANETREKHGPAYFVIEALARTSDRPVLLSGIYAPGEAAYVKSLRGVLVHVQAAVGEEAESPVGLYQRITKRHDGARDQLSVAEFEAAFTRENSGQSECEANVSMLRSMADFCICTAGCIAENYSQVDRFLQEFGND